RMNSGTAVSVKLVTEPQRVGATRPNASSPPPTMNSAAMPMPNRPNATGTPTASSAMRPANIARPIRISIGSPGIVDRVPVGSGSLAAHATRHHREVHDEQPEHAQGEERVGDPERDLDQPPRLLSAGVGVPPEC